MTLEEILVKVGLDGSSLSQGVRKLKTELGDLSQHGHAGFVHMGNEGREFHKLIERITTASPLAGAALRGVFTPVVGLITLAAMALEAYNKRLEETRKLQDEQGLRNSKASFDILEAQSKVHDHVVDAVTEQSKFQEQLKEQHNEKLDKLKEEEQRLEAQLKLDEKRLETTKELSSYAKEKVALETKVAQSMLAQQQATQKSLSAELTQAQKMEQGYYQQYRSAPEYEESVKAGALVASTKAEVERLTERGNQLRNEIGGLAPGVIGAGARLAQGLRTRSELEEEEKENAEELQRQKNLYEKQRHALQELTDRLKVQRDQWDVSKDQVTKLSDAVHGLTEKISETKNKLALASFTQNPLQQFMPGLSEFAETRGPIGNLARQIMGTRQGIGNQLLRGNTAGADYLRKQLQGYDVQSDYMVPDWSHGGKLAMPKPTHVKGLEDRWAEIMRAIVGDNGVPVQIMQVAD